MTEIAGIEVRPPAADDVPAISRLYETAKGRRRPESVTRHRLFDTPWGDSVALAAMTGGRCVGLLSLWPVATRVAGEPVLAAQATEAVVHPDYRRRRLFLRLLGEALERARQAGIGFVYGFPNSQSAGAFRHFDTVFLGDVPVLGLESATGRRGKLFPKRDAGSDLAVGPPDAAELQALVARAQAETDVVRVEKSPAWLSWRYSESTCERYEWLTLRGASGELAAALLLGERDGSWGHDFAGIVRVHEIFAESEAAATALLRQAGDHVRARGGRKLDLLIKEPVVERAAECARLEQENGRLLIVIPDPVNALAATVGEFDRWRVVSGDMDFF